MEPKRFLSRRASKKEGDEVKKSKNRPLPNVTCTINFVRLWHWRGSYECSIMKLDSYIESGKRYHYYINWTLPYTIDRSDISYMTRTIPYALRMALVRCGKAKWYKLDKLKIDTVKHPKPSSNEYTEWNSNPKMNG